MLSLCNVSSRRLPALDSFSYMRCPQTHFSGLGLDVLFGTAFLVLPLRYFVHTGPGVKFILSNRHIGPVIDHRTKLARPASLPLLSVSLPPRCHFLYARWPLGHILRAGGASHSWLTAREHTCLSPFLGLLLPSFCLASAIHVEASASSCLVSRLFYSWLPFGTMTLVSIVLLPAYYSRALISPAGLPATVPHCSFVSCRPSHGPTDLTSFVGGGATAQHALNSPLSSRLLPRETLLWAAVFVTKLYLHCVQIFCINTFFL